MGHKLSEETKQKISLAHQGKVLSEEWKRKISISSKGINTWSNGCILSETTRVKIGNALRGRKYPNRPSFITPEGRKKISLRHTGANSPNWKGGFTPEYIKIRQSSKSRRWRDQVFQKDNFVCQKCEIRGGYLEPHHIFNFADYPELRFSLDNGVTLHKECHSKFHKKYGKKNNNALQFEEFINPYLMVVNS